MNVIMDKCMDQFWPLSSSTVYTHAVSYIHALLHDDHITLLGFLYSYIANDINPFQRESARIPFSIVHFVSVCVHV